ncbi:MAG: WD40/YVTN/BNR-like repeat-containing protein [Candidatus Dormibacteria bacterium]
MRDRDDELTRALQDYYQRIAQQPASDVTGRVMRSTDRRAARARRLGALGGGLLAAAVVGVVVAVALANHNQPTTVAPGQTPSPAPSPTATLPLSQQVPPGPPVQGFVPADVTAISADEWWVIGHDGPACSSSACTRIVHTTDGGGAFSSIPVPPVSPGVSGKPVRLRFADPANGWVVSAQGVVWATHDGGAQWIQDTSLGFVSDLAASGGAVYAVVCTGAPSCTVERSPTDLDSWSALPASGGHGSLSNLQVNGGHVWVAVASAAGGPGWLLTSTDNGQHFVMRTACPSVLGYASVYATDSSTLWATCATGTEASAYRSVDGGQHFTQLPGRISLPSFATIAGVSPTTAVIAGIGLQRTTDGGQTFTSVKNDQLSSTIVGFTSPVNGFAFSTHGPAGGEYLLRTNDAGAHWSQVAFP